MRESLSLLETASLLDELPSTSTMGRGLRDPEVDRWGSVGRHARLDPADPESPLFAGPVVSDSVDLGIRSPYSIAAYLRLWSACLDRRVAGLSTSEEVPVRWGIVDLDEKTRQQPRFRVGLRFGSGSPRDLRAAQRPPVHGPADGPKSHQHERAEWFVGVSERGRHRYRWRRSSSTTGCWERCLGSRSAVGASQEKTVCCSST